MLSVKSCRNGTVFTAYTDTQKEKKEKKTQCKVSNNSYECCQHQSVQN